MARTGIKRIVRTDYDDFILVSKYGTEEVEAYEGFDLCPKAVQEYINANGFADEIPCTHFEAVAYGYV